MPRAICLRRRESVQEVGYLHRGMMLAMERFLFHASWDVFMGGCASRPHIQAVFPPARGNVHRFLTAVAHVLASPFRFPPRQPASRQAPSSLLSSTFFSMATADRHIVMTGMGITSCLGNTLEDVTRSLHMCASGLDYDPEWAKLGIKSNMRRRPSLTDVDIKGLIPKSNLRFMGKNAQYTYVAMQRAV